MSTLLAVGLLAVKNPGFLGPGHNNTAIPGSESV